MQSVKINNNLSVNVISMTKLKTTSVGVYIHRPLCESDASYNALLPLVLKSGNKLCPDREAVAKYLENLYGASMGATTLKRGEDHIIYFDAETISDRYAPEGEPLVADLLRLVLSSIFEPAEENGAFNERIVEQEKVNAIDKLDAFVNDKRSYASSRCQQETARGTDFAILRYGTKEGLSEITAKSLYDYYKSIITASVIDVYICGDADAEAAAEVVREYTDRFSFTDAEIPKTEIISRAAGDIHNVTEEMDVAQGKIAIGFLTNVKPSDSDYDALIVFNSVFGAGAHSKLFNNVREKLSLCYYASSQIERAKGIITVNAGIEFQNFGKAYDEILVQLDEIRKGNISDAEFNASVSALVNMYNSYYDDQRAMATFSLVEKINGTNRTVEECIEGVKAVTVDQTAAVAKKLQLDTVYFLKGKEKA
ncbi:MAG: EF-P 5-aminopentanol modification-associated protein YfmF [Candidatus Ornithomonoglobus sp.]